MNDFMQVCPYQTDSSKLHHEIRRLVFLGIIKLVGCNCTKAFCLGLPIGDITFFLYSANLPN